MRLIPAFGNEYRASAGVLHAWESGAIFLAPELRRYFSRFTLPSQDVTFEWQTELGTRRCFTKHIKP